MPCSDVRENPCSGLVDGYQTEIRKLRNKITKLEAGLCAIITELEKKGIAQVILAIASRRGKIDLDEFWKNHSKEDKTRLRKQFKKFSEHEQEVIKELIRKGKL